MYTGGPGVPGAQSVDVVMSRCRHHVQALVDTTCREISALVSAQLPSVTIHVQYCKPEPTLITIFQEYRGHVALQDPHQNIQILSKKQPPFFRHSISLQTLHSLGLSKIVYVLDNNRVVEGVVRRVVVTHR